MRIFKGFNKVGDPCPICGTHDDKECTLVGIDGTEEGHNMQAKAVHVDCLDLRLSDHFFNRPVIYQFIEQK